VESGVFAPGTSSKLIYKRHYSPLKLIQTASSVVVVWVTLYLSAIARNGSFGDYYLFLFLAIVGLMLFFYNQLGVYSRHCNFYGSFIKLFKAWLLIGVVIIVVGFVSKISHNYSRQIIITFLVFNFVAQICAHLFLMRISKAYYATKNYVSPALIIGTEPTSKFLIDKINNNPWTPTRIVGVIGDDIKSDGWKHDEIPLLGEIKDINGIIEKNFVETVYIAISNEKSSMIEDIYINLISQNINVNWVPDIFGMHLLNHSVREIGGMPIICLSESPMIGNKKYLKATQDYLLACMLLVMFAPLMLSVAMIIKMTSRGPVLFKQKRHGWSGKVFEVYKFRTMLHDLGNNGSVPQATKDDLRVTRIGKILRSFSLDELPQLLNVLRGEMSVIGPRPHAIEHNNYYSDKIMDYLARHNIKPGITGWAQVNGFRGETEDMEKMKKRIEYDLDYISNWSLMLDLQIIVKTVILLFSVKAIRETY